MKMIVGLGNPGKEYENTRHNVGFMVIDNFAESLGIKIDKKKFNGLYESVLVNGEKIILLKPLSYMNLSGSVVKKFVDYYDLDPSDILVISDDLDLPFLTYRLRLFGSSGGHNGLKDIEKHLQTNKFKRFRIGISNDRSIDAVDYVLGKFSKEDLDKLEKVFDKTDIIIEKFVNEDFNKIMNEFN